MNCAAARDMMLEADLAELEGTIESELSRHVRDCAQCAAAARHILAAERELRHALSNAAPRLAADHAIQRATRRPPPYRRAWPAIALAAAATLAALLLGRPEPIGPGLPSTPPPRVGSGLAVEAPPGRSVAVFHTDNPNIVVIWFY
jgi:anti-sigma factor RsiW